MWMGEGAEGDAEEDVGDDDSDDKEIGGEEN